MMRQPAAESIARDHVASATVARDLLREELAKTHPQAHTVNVLRDDVRHAVKLAEVHAELNTGAQLERIANALERIACRGAGVELLVGGGADYSTEEPPC